MVVIVRQSRQLFLRILSICKYYSLTVIAPEHQAICLCWAINLGVFDKYVLEIEDGEEPKFVVDI